MKKSDKRVRCFAVILMIGVMIIFNQFSNNNYDRIEIGVPDVVRSDIFRVGDTYSESLIVVANKDEIIDENEFVEKILQMYFENSFSSIDFSIDENGYPTDLYIDVYLWKEDIENNEPIIRIQCEPQSSDFRREIVKDAVDDL